MTTHLVTFSDESMSRARELCVDSAMRYGVDDYDAVSLAAIADWPEPHGIRLTERGCGYWAWKPLIIHDMLANTVGLRDGDTFIYADAGIEFIAPVQHIIERMDQDVWLFGNNWEHAHWCKRDVVEAVWPMSAFDRWSGGYNKTEFHNHTWQRFGKQVQASVIFFRVSDYSRQFVAEWLKWCLRDGGRLIDDTPSIAPNHPEFREHRHDQSILTTLSYREGLRLHWWPAIYNRFVPGGPVFIYDKGEYQDDYPPLFHHHRLRNWEWPAAPIP